MAFVRKSEGSISQSILFLTNELNRSNGWATVGVELSRRLKERYNVIVASVEGDVANPGFDAIAKGWFYNPLKLRRTVQRVLDLLPTKKIDLIICGIEPHLPVAALLKKSLNAKKMIMIGQGTHAYFPFIEFPEKYYNRFFSKSIDLIVVPSQFTCDKVKQWFKGHVEIVPWGVDAENYYPVENVERESAFIFVGAQKTRKGVETLVKAFKKIVDEFSETKLYLIGNIEKEFVKMVQALDLQNQVVFVGHVSHKELLHYYSKCVCHVLPSVNSATTFEGYGLTHLEANACGIPSIGTWQTANEEVIVDGKTGYLCLQNDANNLYDKMRLMLTDQDAHQRMCAAALAHAREATWEKATEQLSSYF